MFLTHKASQEIYKCWFHLQTHCNYTNPTLISKWVNRHLLRSLSSMEHRQNFLFLCFPDGLSFGFMASSSLVLKELNILVAILILVTGFFFFVLNLWIDWFLNCQYFEWEVSDLWRTKTSVLSVFPTLLLHSRVSIYVSIFYSVKGFFFFLMTTETTIWRLFCLNSIVFMPWALHITPGRRFL